MSSFPSNLHNGLAVLVLTSLISGCGGNDDNDNTIGAISRITVAGTKASVTVAGGGLNGTATDATLAFLGVPFAQAPVGARRWQPPVAAAAWGATRDASQYAKHCPQPGSAMSAQPSASEDCLYLNVFVPKAVAASQPGGRRAVMVWIYGGANAQGTSETYDPTPIVTSDDVIAVTVNYRVGALGFLSHPAIDAEGHLFANYGVMDQQLALKWVQDNIESFGGDRNNVTIFGESAGGLNTLTHLVSPLSAGLYSKAIVESGAYQLNTPSVPASQAMGAAFATRIGCTDQSAACLRGKSVDEILAQQGTVNTAGSAYNQSTADGKILPEPQLAALSGGRFNRVPVMQGANAHEGRIFNSPAITQAQYQASVTAFAAGVGKTGAEALAAYPLSEYGTPFEAASAALGDFAFACSSRRLSRLLSARVPTYSYEFDDPNASALGATHGAEISYLLKVAETTGRGWESTGPSLQLSTTMRHYWAQFAKASDPNLNGSPLWAPYQAATDNVQYLVPGGVRQDSSLATRHKCAFWG